MHSCAVKYGTAVNGSIATEQNVTLLCLLCHSDSAAGQEENAAGADQTGCVNGTRDHSVPVL